MNRNDALTLIAALAGGVLLALVLAAIAAAVIVIA